MSKKSSTVNTSSKKINNTKTPIEDEIIAQIEISDGNCLKQTVEYIKSTTTMVPLVFYRDRMEIVRGNYESTLVNKAIFNNLEFILKYYVNEDLFNDPDFERVVKIPTGELDSDGNPIFKEETIKDPRHIFIPEIDKFYRQCKNIARRDGFRITIYKTSQNKTKSKSYGKKINPSNECYAKASRISSNSAPEGSVTIKCENINDYKDYGFSFIEPRFGKINQKIKLAELCTSCNGFVRQRCEATSLMCYHDGFRMQDGENKSIEDGWGTYCDTEYKGKIAIGGLASKHNNFGVPMDFMRALFKLQTIAGNGGVTAIYSHEQSLQIIMPIGVIGRLIITIIPPDEDEEEETKPAKKELSSSSGE